LNLFEFVEQEKSWLVQELNKLFSHFSLSESPILAESLERFLRDRILVLLTKHSYPLMGIKCTSDNCFFTAGSGKCLISIKIAEDIRNFGSLCIVIEPHIGANANTKEFNIAIGGYGKIKNISIIYPVPIKIKLDAINSLLKNIFETGYHWFQLKMEELSSSEKVALTQKLYNYIKNIITSDELRKHLWFATVTKGYGFRLIERDVSMALFPSIEPNASRYGHSTNRLVAEMLSTKLPGEYLLMPKAIAQNKIMDVNICDAKYSKDGHIYAGTMKAFYRNDSFTIHPVSIQRDTGIVALYPTDKRIFFEPVLQQHISKIQEICLESTSKVHSALELFKSKSSGSSEWAKHLGAFFRGFIDN
jgi:hypothetical protein